jgi:hypothetical protein
MDKDQVHEKLHQLHEALHKVESVDDGDKVLLAEIQADIRELLDLEKAEQSSRYESFVERLRQGVDRFEANHPDLTSAMGQMADMLARMGI